MADPNEVDILAFEEYLDGHPFIEAYANGACQPFRPYAQLVWLEACAWARGKSEKA